MAFCCYRRNDLPGFPRLASLLARDRFLPHQFAFLGDRLSFTVGIVALAFLAGLLLVIFHGDTNALINLFAVGVFVSFTLSQSGMVPHWWRLRGQVEIWRRSILIDSVGALTTALVALVIAVAKFIEGAWIVVLLIPILVLTLQAIHHHYTRYERERTTDIPLHPQDIQHRLIVPIDRLDRAWLQVSLMLVRSLLMLQWSMLLLMKKKLQKFRRTGRTGRKSSPKKRQPACWFGYRIALSFITPPVAGLH